MNIMTLRFHPNPANLAVAMLAGLQYPFSFDDIIAFSEVDAIVMLSV